MKKAIIYFIMLLSLGCTKKTKVSEKETVSISQDDTIEIQKEGINRRIIKIKEDLKENKENSELHLELARANMQKRNSFSAMKAAQQAIKYKPNLSEGYKIVGDGYFDRENFKEAEDYYIKALGIDENYADAHYGLANCLLTRRDYKSAEEEFSLAIKNKKDFELAYLNRGVVYSKLKNYPNALDDFLKVISINSNNANAYFNAGIIFEKMKKNNKAIEYYQKYLKFQPFNMTVRKWIIDLKNKS